MAVISSNLVLGICVTTRCQIGTSSAQTDSQLDSVESVTAPSSVLSVIAVGHGALTALLG